MASAWRRTYGRAQLEVLHSLGGPHAASRQIVRTPVRIVFACAAAALLAVAQSNTSAPADFAVERTDSNSQTAHQQLLAKRTQGRIDVYFEGDSIVRRWGATDYPQLLANWNKNFFGWNAADFGWGADRAENILWRLQHGELDDV